MATHVGKVPVDASCVEVACSRICPVVGNEGLS